jgi:hypothetical protein
VLNRQHTGVTVGQRRRHPRVGDSGGPDDDVYRVGQIDPTEHNARIGWRGPQRQLNPLTTVQPHANGTV